MREGNILLEQSSKLTNEWTMEYQKAFNPESRAKFPGNRDELRSHAEKIITILDESNSLERRIANNYEEASTLSPNGQERRGVASIAAALRKNIEGNQLVKSQVRLVSDDEITDEKTFNEKFMRYMQLIEQNRTESEDLFNQGKRLLKLQ